MCGPPNYSSPIAVAQPSTSSCCPITPTMNTSSGSLGRYIRMDSTSLDFVQSAPVVVQGQHLSYWATIGVIVLAAWVFQLLQASRASKVKVPYYKASIFKWYFSAETLVRDSYSKVSKRDVWMRCCLCALADIVISSSNKSTKSRPQKVFR